MVATHPNLLQMALIFILEQLTMPPITTISLKQMELRKERFVYQIFQTQTYSGFSGIELFNSKVIFTFNGNNLYGQELYVSDGSTEDGATLLKDIYAGSTGSSPYYFTEVNGELFFRARTAAENYELWKTDGTTAGTNLVKDIYVGSSSSSPQNFFAYNNELYFSANDGSSGYELWKSDGTESGTVLAEDLHVGSNGSSPQGFSIIGGKLYFSASNSSDGKDYVHVYDGTDFTSLLGFDNLGANEDSSEDSYFKVFGDKIIFTGTERYTYRGNNDFVGIYLLDPITNETSLVQRFFGEMKYLEPFLDSFIISTRLSKHRGSVEIHLLKKGLNLNK